MQPWPDSVFEERRGSQLGRKNEKSQIPLDMSLEKPSMDEFPTESILYSSKPHSSVNNTTLGMNLETPKSKNKLGETFVSPSRYDPHNDMTTKPVEIDFKDLRWVRVFGYPGDQSSYILKQFGQYGTILEYKMGDGNWMDICYKEKIQAQRALAKNAKIFNRNLMVGVVECVEHKPVKKRSFEESSPLKGSDSRKERKVSEEDDDALPKKSNGIFSFFENLLGL